MRKDKVQAFEMRRRGMSFNEIVAELGMSKSTLSHWFRDVDWSREIGKNLSEQVQKESTGRIYSLNKKRGAVLKAWYMAAEEEARQEMERLRHNPLFISAIAMYWGEGDKCTKGLVRITNTDPQMLVIFRRFLVEICNVPEAKLRGALFLYSDLNESLCREYWVTQVGIRRFHKTMFLPSRHSSKRLPYGTCTLTVSSSYLKHKMLTWIDLMPEMILNSDSKTNAGIV